LPLSHEKGDFITRRRQKIAKKRKSRLWSPVDLTRALELDPKLRGAYSRLGDARKITGDYDGAVADYMTVLSDEPPDVDVYISLGDIKYIRKDYKSAVAYFTRAIELQPYEAQTYLKRAAAYRALNDLKRAEADERKAATLPFE